MASFDDVARIASRLPEVTEQDRRGTRVWSVAGKAFAWERPLNKADIKRYGEKTPPEGPLLAVRTFDLEEKDLVLMANPRAFFTIPHFDGYDAILIQLKRVTPTALKRAVEDAWRARAPKKLIEPVSPKRPPRTPRRTR